MVEQDNKFNNIMINDEICVETMVYNQSMHFEGTLVSIDDENIELLLSNGKNFKIPKTQIVKINSKKNTQELVSTICSETDEDQIDIDDKDYCGCIIYDIDFSVFEPRKEKSEMLSYQIKSLVQMLNWSKLFETDVFNNYFETSADSKSVMTIVEDVLKERNKIFIKIEKIKNALKAKYIPKVPFQILILDDTFHTYTNYLLFLYYDFFYGGQVKLQNKIDCFEFQNYCVHNLFISILEEFCDTQERSVKDSSKNVTAFCDDLISIRLLLLYQHLMTKYEELDCSVGDLDLTCSVPENADDDSSSFLILFLIYNITILHAGRHLPGNLKSLKRLFESTESDYFYKKLPPKLNNYLSCDSLEKFFKNIESHKVDGNFSIPINSLKRKLFIPLLNNINTGKEFVLYTLYSSFISNCKTLSLYIQREEDKKNLKYTLSNVFNIKTNLSLTDDFRILFDELKKFLVRIIEILGCIIDVKSEIVFSSEKIDSLIFQLKQFGCKFIFLNRKTQDNYLEFLARFRNVISVDNELSFDERERLLIQDKDYCRKLISAAGEPFCSYLQLFMITLNDLSHIIVFASKFYAKYDHVVSVEILPGSSSNVDLDTVFVPLSFCVSEHSQPVEITQLSYVIAGEEYYEKLKSEISIHPTKCSYRLLRLPLSKINCCKNENGEVPFLIKATYRFKKTYDYGNKKFLYSEDNLEKELLLSCDCKKIFTDINNEFENYRSGCVVVDQNMFFGRSKDIENILNNLRDQNGRMISNRCICIYGQTRTGKSSILYHLKNRLKNDERNIVIDFGDIGSLEISDNGFRYKILRELVDTIEYEHSSLYELFLDNKFDLSIDDDSFDKNPSVYFDTFMNRIKKFINQKVPQMQIIVLIDEFTYIYDWIKIGKISEGFMRFWKGMIQNYSICAIIVGQDHMMKFINDPAFTNCFGAVKTHEVTYLKQADAAKLIREPVSKERCGEQSCIFNQDAVEYLINFTKGSAYLLMNLCADFVDYMNELHSNEVTLAHVFDFIEQYAHKVEERLFEPLYNDKISLDSDTSINANKRILTKIAHAGDSEGYVILEELGLTSDEKERVLNLRDRHVLEFSQNRCRIAVRLYDLWLRKNS